VNAALGAIEPDGPFQRRWLVALDVARVAWGTGSEQLLDKALRNAENETAQVISMDVPHHTAVHRQRRCFRRAHGQSQIAIFLSHFNRFSLVRQECLK
jgi:hypothetical protein